MSNASSSHAVPNPRNEGLVECDDAEEDSWGFFQVVVEGKHRMHQLQSTPPLYEMNQANEVPVLSDVSN